MDRYFLILTPFKENGTDEVDGVNVVENLLDFLNNNCNNVELSENFEENGYSQADKAENYYWSLIAMRQKCSTDDVSYTGWSKMCQTDDCNETISKISDKLLTQRHHCSAANAIHHLCDQLPLGPYLVDLIWIVYQPEELPDIEENVELFGSCSRLTQWHQAILSFCCCRNVNIFRDKLTNWIKLFPVQTVSFPFQWKQLFCPMVVWRGALHLVDHTNSSSLSMDGFQLVRRPFSCGRLQSLKGDRNETYPLQFLNRRHTEDEEQVFFSGSLTMAGKIPFTSIPPHAIADVKFELILPQPLTSRLTSLSVLDTSWEFLAQANAEENVCHILQLGVFSTSVLNNSSFPTTTEEWKQRVVAGQCMASFKTTQQAAGHCFLVVVGNGSCTPHTASVFMLRNTDDYSPEVCQAFAYENTKRCNNIEIFGTDRSFVDNLPILSSKDVEQLENVFQKFRMKSFHNFVGEPNSTVPEICPREFAREISLQILNFKNHCSNDLQYKHETEIHKIVEVPSERFFSGKLPVSNTDLSEDDPTLWPEKSFLKGINTFCKYSSSLEHLAPFPQPSTEAVFLHMDRLLEKLDANKQSFFNYSVSNTNSVGPPVSLLTSWPSAKHCSFHGLYYNKDEDSELKQQQANQLQARFITCDTASSFHHFSEPRSTITKQQIFVKNATDSKLAQKPYNRFICKTAHVSKSRTNSGCQETKTEVEKNFRPLKNGLSEPHLKKLRIAVVDALEMHGIRLESSLFKTCARKLFAICLTFAKDVVGEGRTSKRFKAIAESHVQQVISFETNRPRSSTVVHKTK